MCNGGLCNWDTEDTPWYEHNKWFSGCRYVKECIKHPVVKAIIETATSIQVCPKKLLVITVSVSNMQTLSQTIKALSLLIL